MSFDKEIEAEIVEKGLAAPRVTLDHIESTITGEHYFTAWEGRTGANMESPEVRPHENQKVLETLTFCVLSLRNGFMVTGESACASPENFDAEIGRKIARDNAVQKIWALEGYLLKEKLHNV